MSNKDNYSIDPGEQNQPGQHGHVVFAIPSPQQAPQEQIHMTDQQMFDFSNGKIRALHAQSRPMETKILLDFMVEIRHAISMPEVASGDSGTSERPPLTPAFNDTNRGKLQNAYLTLAERAVNYCDHMLSKEFKIATTNEIKKSHEKNI